MSAQQATAPSQEGIMRDQDFRDIAALAKENFGLSLSDTKKPLIQSRLSKRLKLLGLPDFGSYCTLLKESPSADEYNELLSCLTTNVTHFFRENHHFETLKDDLLPGLVAAAQKGARVRLWSAGCSTGQEPYSLAITLLEACNTAASLDIKILATDIDPLVVQTAKLGRYLSEEVTGVSDAQKTKYFKRDGDEFAINDDVKSLVTFGVLNLVAPLPFAGPFDVIFCRNVAIYFDNPTQQSVWSTLVSVLGSDGHLFIGHSERMSGPAGAMLSGAGITTYKRIGA